MTITTGGIEADTDSVVRIREKTTFGGNSAGYYGGEGERERVVM